MAEKVNSTSTNSAAQQAANNAAQQAANNIVQQQMLNNTILNHLLHHM